MQIMALTLNELAVKIGARIIRGNPALAIDSAANLAEAGPGCIAPYTDNAYADLLPKTRAGAVISKQETLTGLPETTALLHSPDPEMSFISAIEALHPISPEPVGIDPKAHVEAGAT